MNIIDSLAEARIAEAAARGEFDDLPGAGRALRLDDDRHVPEELRTGYRLLKNAGFVPPELEWRREIRRLEDLLAALDDDGERERAAQRLNYLQSRLSDARGRAVDLRAEQVYRRKLFERL